MATAPLRPRRIVSVAFPDANAVDVTGPLEVFATASRAEYFASEPVRGYSVEVVAAERGPLRLSSGLELHARGLGDARGPIDTLIVVGGQGSRAAARDEKLVAWLRRAAARSRRVASVCTGAFVLARTGLLDGRRATTHWASCAELARTHPRILVEEDPIFTRDGNVYTSAGVTAGMDLALALLEEDLGRDRALMVARVMVFFLKRPGGQSQFSVELESQSQERTPLAEVQRFIADSPGADLRVEALAARAGMSPRNFARVFRRSFGTTPARYVERVRLELARRLLEETDLGQERIAADCGFGSVETLRRVFLRQLRVPPGEYRLRFQPSAERATGS